MFIFFFIEEKALNGSKYFLEICLNLPKEEQETVITLLREIMVSSEEVPDAAESGM